MSTSKRVTGKRRGDKQAKLIAAGKSSGATRAKLAKLRQFFVLAAFERLKPTYQYEPFSDYSIDALVKEFRRRPKPNPNLHLDPPLGEYESIVSRRPAYSDRLMGLLDEAISVLLEGKAGRLYGASRETLIKDLKALGIRSKRRVHRSG